MFSTLFSACVSRYLHSAHWWSTVVHITQPFGRAGSRYESTGKSFRVIRMFHIIMLSCVFWVARALHWCIQCVPLDSLSGVDGVKLPVTLVVSWWRGSRGTMLLWRHTDGGCGCYSGYRTQGYIAQWLERLTADQQVPGSIPGGGHGLSSWQDPTIWWIIPHSGTTLWAQSEVITTITRKSVNMVAELDYDTDPSRILDTIGQRLECNSTAAKAATATAVALDTKARAAQGTVVQLKGELAQYQQSRTEAKVLHAIALKTPSDFGADTAAVRMPGRLMGLQVQQQHVRLDKDQLTTDTADLTMTKDALAEDTTAFEDTTQDCMVCQTKVSKVAVYTNKNLSEELEALVKAKIVISEKTDDTEYRNNRSVLSSHGGLVIEQIKSENSIELAQLVSLVLILRCTTRSLTTTILSRRSRVWSVTWSRGRKRRHLRTIPTMLFSVRSQADQFTCIWSKGRGVLLITQLAWCDEHLPLLSRKQHHQLQGDVEPVQDEFWRVLAAADKRRCGWVRGSPGDQDVPGEHRTGPRNEVSARNETRQRSDVAHRHEDQESSIPGCVTWEVHECPGGTQEDQAGDRRCEGVQDAKIWSSSTATSSTTRWLQWSITIGWSRLTRTVRVWRRTTPCAKPRRVSARRKIKSWSKSTSTHATEDDDTVEFSPGSLKKSPWNRRLRTKCWVWRCVWRKRSDGVNSSLEMTLLRSLSATRSRRHLLKPHNCSRTYQNNRASHSWSTNHSKCERRCIKSKRGARCWRSHRSTTKRPGRMTTNWGTSQQVLKGWTQLCTRSLETAQLESRAAEEAKDEEAAKNELIIGQLAKHADVKKLQEIMTCGKLYPNNEENNEVYLVINGPFRGSSCGTGRATRRWLQPWEGWGSSRSGCWRGISGSSCWCGKP